MTHEKIISFDAYKQSRVPKTYVQRAYAEHNDYALNDVERTIITLAKNWYPLFCYLGNSVIVYPDYIDEPQQRDYEPRKKGRSKLQQLFLQYKMKRHRMRIIK